MITSYLNVIPDARDRNIISKGPKNRFPSNIDFLNAGTTYWKVTKTQENIIHKRAKTSAPPQQVITRLQGTDKLA